MGAYEVERERAYATMTEKHEPIVHAILALAEAVILAGKHRSSGQCRVNDDNARRKEERMRNPKKKSKAPKARISERDLVFEVKVHIQNVHGDHLPERTMKEVVRNICNEFRIEYGPFLETRWLWSGDVEWEVRTARLQKPPVKNVTKSATKRISKKTIGPWPKAKSKPIPNARA